MSESVKPRFAVDLSEIERQIAQTQAAPAQPASATRNDPLAELARIVGQDDPFQTLLANDGAQRQRQPSASIDDLFAQTAAPSREPQGRTRTEPAFDHAAYAPAQGQGGDQGYGYQQHASSYEQADYDQAYYDQAPNQQAYPEPEALDYPPVARRSRKGLLAVGAVAGAVVLGLGGAYMVTGRAATGVNGAPPLIKAGVEPTKVAPQNPGGVEIPNQNKQIYERAAQNGETKVVNREEQPVDVKQAVRMNGGAVADATGTTVPAGHTQPAAALNLGEPRKVRTVAIRPDGSVAQPAAAAAPAAAPRTSPIPTMTLPAGAQSQPAPVQVASAQATPAPSRPAASTPAAAPVATPAPAATKPTPAASTPSSGASPQKVAAVQPAAPAAAPAADSTSGYAVQLGLANSEAAANANLAQLQKKYADLGSVPSLIRKAEVNGNTIYRIRVGPLSREDASSLCSKLQGQGGQCFVAKN